MASYENQRNIIITSKTLIPLRGTTKDEGGENLNNNSLISMI